MIYQYILKHKPTDGDTTAPHTCHPNRGDDFSVTIDRENGEWYYKRRLDGTLTFINADYEWIMAQDFDGTFTITIMSSTDNGNSWSPYFEGTFSRANLEIDEDNQSATLSSLIEGSYNLLENGKNEEYDLMKLIPDADSREVQGQVHPALAMIDYCSSSINQSDIFCGGAGTAGGYKADKNDYSQNTDPRSNDAWNFLGLYVEAVVETEDPSAEVAGTYTGIINYASHTTGGRTVYGPVGAWDALKNKDNCTLQIDFGLAIPFNNRIYPLMRIWNSDGTSYSTETISLPYEDSGFFTPDSLTFSDGTTYYKKVTVVFHYIRATLLTQSGGNADNVLDTGGYYQRMAAFNNNDGGLQIYISSDTVDQPNGHRLIPGTGEQGTIPQYFAPPVGVVGCIPLAEANWTYASLWYTITPSISNRLTDPDKIGSFRWTRCWTIGTCLRYLLRKISNGSIVFSEDSTSSRFLYDTINPVEGNEPFDYLVTQKSNVMHPSLGGESAARCLVRLEWFLELLRNAFNCYYWLELTNDGHFLFRVEHIEFFRKGGRYEGDLPHNIDLTSIYTRRNFRNRMNLLVKRLSDGTSRYRYEMENMVEKFTFSWQGDGGSDAFKGNPMFFRAGWIEKGSSDNRQVDNIFADLSWLMLNAGTETESSKNYDGLFLFSGYRPVAASNVENNQPESQILLLANPSTMVYVAVDIWITIPEGQTVTLQRHWYTPQQGTETVATYTGTGQKQVITIEFESAFIVPNSLGLNFGSNYAAVTIHRIHARTGNVYNVPNVPNRLNTDIYLQNGPLAWPWLQCEYLHYDVPAQKWSFDSDDIDTATFNDDGTVIMAQKQEVNIFPIPEKSTEDAIMAITGIRTAIEGGKTGIITNAKVNLSSRNAELTIVYDPIPQQ